MKQPWIILGRILSLPVSSSISSSSSSAVNLIRRNALKGRRRRCFSTTATPAAPAATGGAPPTGPAATKPPSKTFQRLKMAVYILGPLSVPAAFVAAIKYDDEFRDDVNARFPEVVDFIRKKVGFEENLDRRRKELEKAFICSQPVNVTVRLKCGSIHSQTVSPLKTLSDLYESIAASPADRPIVYIDFDDISNQPIEDPSIRDPLAPGDPNDPREVVPDLLRGFNKSNLWDQETASVIQKASPMKDQKQARIEELEAQLRDLDEELGVLQDALRIGSDRAVDDIQGDITYLRYQRSQLKSQLRKNGKFWVW